ncbi:MAG: Gfo/Idh/MocA family protein [Bacteroidales bacterium]|jgi:predicted dehydrogenase
MKKTTNSGVNRRDFLKSAALGAVGLTILPSWKSSGLGAPPSDTVYMGAIGLGRQGLSVFRGLTSCKGVNMIAASDVHSLKRVRFQNRVEAWQATAGLNPRCDTYEDYRYLLDRTDIDAIEIASPDHWHALHVIHSAEAGKDIYCEKPLSYTIREAQEMVKAVRNNGRVLQVGSQQRSQATFQKAIELVQAGKIGHITTIKAKVGDAPRPLSVLLDPSNTDPDLQKKDPPAELNWNLWLGPLNDPSIFYFDDICPPISLNPEVNESAWGAWRWYSETGNGYPADWGAHMFDIAQAAIGMDGSGPVEITPPGYNGAKFTTFKYANGIIMTEEDYTSGVSPNSQGIRFDGTKGWITVSRSHISCSDQSLIPAEIAGNPPQSAADRAAAQAAREAAAAAEAARLAAMSKKERKAAEAAAAAAASQIQAGGPGDIRYEISSPHSQDFIDCVRSRKEPIAPVEVGCSSSITCILSNVAMELGRTIHWNPATERFVDDPEAMAHRLYGYDYRSPYKLC